MTSPKVLATWQSVMQEQLKIAVSLSVVASESPIVCNQMAVALVRACELLKDITSHHITIAREAEQESMHAAWLAVQAGVVAKDATP